MQTATLPSFRDLAEKHFQHTQEIEVPSILEVDAIRFLTGSPPYLNASLSSFQSLAIKLIYRLWQKYPFTEDEDELLAIAKSVWDVHIDFNNPFQLIKHIVFVIGRRGMKSSLVSYIATYEAYKLICKGNPQKYYKIKEDYPIGIMAIAAASEQAKTTFGLIKGNIKSCEWFSKYIDPDTDNKSQLYLYTSYDLAVNERIRQENTNRPRGTSRKKMRGGAIHIESITTQANTARSHGIITLIFDEFAHYRRAKFTGAAEQDLVAENQQSDYALMKALVPSTKDFGDDSKVFYLSNPKEKGGEFYKLYCLTGGIEQDEKTRPTFDELPKDHLLLQFATWETNKKITRESLQTDFEKDPVGAANEYGAHFTDPAAAFLDPSKLDAMIVSTQVRSRIGKPQFTYTICLDPANKHDTYALGWGHYDAENDWYVIDGLHGFLPPIIQTGDVRVRDRINPKEVFNFLTGDLLPNLGKVDEICYDQWNSASSIADLQDLGLPALETTFTNQYKAQMFSTFLEKVNLGKIKLYGIEENPVHNWIDTALLQLKFLQKITAGRWVYYAAPDRGMVTNDDFPMVIANLVHRLCLQQGNMPLSAYKTASRQMGRPIPLRNMVLPRRSRRLW